MYIFCQSNKLFEKRETRAKFVAHVMRSHAEP